MNRDTVMAILNTQIFEGDKRNIIEKLASSPERYIGDFRPTKPRAKLIQNLLQSHEIRFGDAIEFLLRQILVDQGFTNLDRKLTVNSDKVLSVDQYFKKKNAYFFIEQKIRDDHDSSKKKGQISNFAEKSDFLFKRHSTKITGIMYFVDPSFSKNRNYYLKELSILGKAYPIELRLLYGQDLFSFLHCPQIWLDLSSWVKNWKSSLDDFPSIDLDISPEASLEELKLISPNDWRKFLGNYAIWDDGIIRVIFSDGTTLRLLFGFFSQHQNSEYNKLAKALLERINTFYS